jgi:hypothetical protein
VGEGGFWQFRIILLEFVTKDRHAQRNLRVVREGERTSPQGKPVYNRILLALPDNEFRSIRPHLEFLPLPQNAGWRGGC